MQHPSPATEMCDLFSSSLCVQRERGPSPERILSEDENQRCGFFPKHNVRLSFVLNTQNAKSTLTEQNDSIRGLKSIFVVVEK